MPCQPPDRTASAGPHRRTPRGLRRCYRRLAPGRLPAPCPWPAWPPAPAKFRDEQRCISFPVSFRCSFHLPTTTKRDCKPPVRSVDLPEANSWFFRTVISGVLNVRSIPKSTNRGRTVGNFCYKFSVTSKCAETAARCLEIGGAPSALSIWGRAFALPYEF